MNKNNFLRKFKSAAAALATTAIFAISLGAPSAQAVGVKSSQSNFDFVSCVQSEKAGSVLLLMDESASIYGNTKDASDPENYRVTSSKIMLDAIQRVADVYKAKIQVQLAGLGDDFKSRSAGAKGWVTLTPGNANAGLAELTAATEAWKQPAKDGNGRETDVFSSIAGAQEAFESQSSCKLLVLFKDGQDYQYFNPKNTSPVADESITELIQKGEFREATALAEEEICRPQGRADGFRASNIFILSVALGTSSEGADFSKLKALTEGGADCGAQAGYGRMLTTQNPSELAQKFSSVLDPSFTPGTRSGNFDFNMSEALSSISITTTGSMGAFGKYEIVPPKTCVGGAQTFEKSSTPKLEGDFGNGVKWTSKWFDDSAFKIVIDHVPGSSSSCWVGKWTVKPNGGNDNTSILQFDANLEAVATFAEKDFYLVPGGDSKEYSVALRRISTGEIIDVASLDPSFAISINGRLEDKQGSLVSQAFSNLDKSTISEAQILSAAQDLPLGTYRLVLELNADVKGLGVPLRTIRTEQNIEVRNKNQLPRAISGIDFGDIGGHGTVEREIVVKQSPDSAFTLQLRDAKSKVMTTQQPKGLVYEFAVPEGLGTVKIPKGTGETKVKVAIHVAGNDSVKKQGPVAGYLEIVAVPEGSESYAEAINIPFKANQKAEANELLRWLFLVLFTLAGLAITLGALQLVGWIISKFPTQLEIANRQIQSLALSGNIQDSTFVPSGQSNLEQVTQVNAWGDIAVESNRKSAHISNYTFAAKSPGWRLGSPGYAIATASGLVGWGSGLDSGDPDGKALRSGAPLVSLHLQRNWVVLIDKSNLPSSWDPNGGNTPIPATVILIIGADSSTSNLQQGGFGSFGSSNDDGADRQRMINEIQSSIPHQLPALLKRFGGQALAATANQAAVQNVFEQTDPFGSSANGFTNPSNDPFA